MIKIAIIDDEEIFAKKLEGIVSDYMSTENDSFQIDIFTSGIEFTKLGVAMFDYKIVCLDMRMDEMDGMAVARKLREYDQDIYIICISAFIDFALAGYEVGALRYILKNGPNFIETVHEALKEACIKIDIALKREIFHFKEGDIELPISKIIYVESSVHKAIFHVKGNTSDDYKKYSIRKTLGSVEEQLSQYGFIRIHQSYLVNYRFIERITNYKAFLINQKALSIPRKKYKDVKREYLIYRGHE